MSGKESEADFAKIWNNFAEETEREFNRLETKVKSLEAGLAVANRRK